MTEERIKIKVRKKNAKNNGFISLVKALNRGGKKNFNYVILKTVPQTLKERNSVIH